MKILLAGAESSEQSLFDSLSRRKGHLLSYSQDNKQTLEKIKQNQIDLIVLGSHLSRDEGVVLIKSVKELLHSQYLPILAITDSSHQDKIQAYVDVGIDDFISSIYSEPMLDAKLELIERVKNFAKQYQKSSLALGVHEQHLENDIQVAKVIFAKILKEGCLDIPNIKYTLSPNFSYKGELLIAQKKPNNDLCLMLGDFPGHGLQASIGAIAIAEIFYAMIAKGYSLKHLLQEINKRLKAIFPPSIFCRACVVDMDMVARRARIWNAGMPDCYLLRPGEGIRVIASGHQFPLGIVTHDHFEAQIQEINLEYGDKIYILSDEILKIENSVNGRMTPDKLFSLLKECENSATFFDDVQKKLLEYAGNIVEFEKPTIAEITLLSIEQKDAEGKLIPQTNRSHMQDWQFSLELHPVSLREFDPLPLLLDLMMECPDLHDHRGAIYTILAELYSNALEHGVLKMDSSLKSEKDGFAKYYEVRNKRLQDLAEGYIRFTIKHKPIGQGGEIEIRIEDSGEGFNYQHLNTQLKKSVLYSGRGIPLIKHLADEIHFEDKGNRVCVKFRFGPGSKH